MPESTKTNANLWAARIGGAERVDDYTAPIEVPHFEGTELRDDARYRFASDQAQNARQKYGVKSVSLDARKR